MNRLEKLTYIKNLHNELDAVNAAFQDHVITFVDFHRTGCGKRIDTNIDYVIHCKRYIDGVICEMFGDQIEIIPGKENDKVVEVSIIADFYKEPNKRTWKCENYCGIAGEKDFLLNIIFNHYFND